MRKIVSLIAFGVASIVGASAHAQAPNWNGPYQDPPRGSYTQSCREITTFNGEVHARCKTSRGGWTWVSAYLRDCNSQGMANGDGKLICQSQAGNGGGGGGWNGGGGPGYGGGGGGRPNNNWRGDIVLFEDKGYEGGAYEVIGDIPDLGAVKFNDRASSIKIVRGASRWEICEHTNYQGRCAKLDADQFVLPREWNDQISSIRRVR
jgi:hypothetical protein